MKKLSLFLVALTIALVSCESEIENPTAVEPTVVTKSVKEITESTAEVVGQVASDGGAEVTERGVCWNSDGTPTILDYRVKDAEVGLGTFTSKLSDLEANTTYYVRAYATNEVGTSYGEEMSFTTGETANQEDPETQKHEWVDLGLSVKWATCNVGASSPEEYGNYYAWGETSIKAEYVENNNLTYGLSISELESKGYIDSEGNLTSSYDAATVNWGEEWRMPTFDEMEELAYDCHWTWAVLDGVTGYYVTGPSGKSIFLPAAGNRYESFLDDAGKKGFYWCSTPNDVDNSDDDTAIGRYAYRLGFNSDYLYDSDNGYRAYGQSVRPVFK
ncbi:MAG: hypothetical protein IKW46_02700 [Bacteroidaceae bacterium]|nr:hypothetical protein [Bacteroidaceae bacterium]